MSNLDWSPTRGNIDVFNRLEESGLHVIPLKTDGSKSPIKTNWQAGTLHRDFREPYFLKDPDQTAAIGIVCGAPSGGLEVLDFDWNGFSIFQDFKKKSELFKKYKFPIVRTGGGGIHIFYRCDAIEGSQPLARRVRTASDDKTIKIETRGIRAQVVSVGSPPRTHASGKIYELIAGDLLAIPRISEIDRQELLRLARSFDELPIFEKPIKLKAQRIDGEIRKTFNGNDIETSDFKNVVNEVNQYMDWDEVLEPAGWTLSHYVGDVGYWSKPGKGFGTQATTDYVPNRLYVWSTEIDLFEAEKPFDKFEVLYRYSGLKSRTVLKECLKTDGFGSIRLFLMGTEAVDVVCEPRKPN